MKKIFAILSAFMLLTMIILTLTSCSNVEEDKEYVQSIEKWKENRIAGLTKPDSWLSLVGLHWLKQGENKFGSHKSNDLIFTEKAPPFIGSFFLQDSIVTVEILPEANVLIDSAIVKESELRKDTDGNPTIMSINTLTWFVIKRGSDKYGIRVKDTENDLLKNFSGIEMYPISKKWRIEATLQEYNPPKKIIIPSVIGTADEEDCAGRLIFSIEGNEYGLDVQDAGKNYFIVFADLTNGEETYGAGRFLSVAKPDSTGKIYVDFNKAYNPPCAFTKYATCPLPPKENILKVAIEAGEKKFGDGHH